jgi:hypothetical protein
MLMSLNSGKSSAADLRWRRQRKALDKAKADRRAYAKHVIIKVSEDMEAEFARLTSAKEVRVVGIDVGAVGSDSSALVLGRQLGKNLYIEGIRHLQAETRFMRSDPVQELNEAALREIERILDDYEAAAVGSSADTGTLGVESIRRDLRELFGVRGGAAGGVEQKHR